MNRRLCDKIIATKRGVILSASMATTVSTAIGCHQHQQQVIYSRNICRFWPLSMATTNMSSRMFSTTTVHRSTTQDVGGFRTNYEILGITPNATEKEIKSAYYSLTKTCHPDVNESAEAKRQFQSVGEAYEVLSNGDKRRAYDQSIGNTYRYRHLRQHNQRSDIQTTGQTNQQNLDNYRENKFTDNETVGNRLNYAQLLRNRRRQQTVRMENIYKSSDDLNSGGRDRWTYEDPLKHDPKYYYDEIFTEKHSTKYADEVDKQAREMAEKEEKHNLETGGILALVATVMLLLVIVPELIEANTSITESPPPPKLSRVLHLSPYAGHNNNNNISSNNSNNRSINSDNT
ncbi:uncharacterized protein LOC128953580 [Oppia nitens]|uniref:uncharacterized protein LOC128953580 n=1 Tax=Oppia nitens TaxID=1686743 RepID=UPI0023D9C408|nr:uncharacterized protein LOC128953580 [Oppia nitens]